MSNESNRIEAESAKEVKLRENRFGMTLPELLEHNQTLLEDSQIHKIAESFDNPILQRIRANLELVGTAERPPLADEFTSDKSLHSSQQSENLNLNKEEEKELRRYLVQKAEEGMKDSKKKEFLYYKLISLDGGCVVAQLFYENGTCKEIKSAEISKELQTVILEEIKGMVRIIEKPLAIISNSLPIPRKVTTEHKHLANIATPIGNRMLPESTNSPKPHQVWSLESEKDVTLALKESSIEQSRRAFLGGLGYATLYAAGLIGISKVIDKAPEISDSAASSLETFLKERSNRLKAEKRDGNARSLLSKIKSHDIKQDGRPIDALESAIQEGRELGNINGIRREDFNLESAYRKALTRLYREK